MQPPVGGAHQSRSLGNRLDDARLVVGQHEGDEGLAVGSIPKGQPVAQPGQIGDTVRIDRQDLDLDAEDPRDHLNVVFIGHVDAGKSTLTEALVLHAKVITEAGAIHGKAGRRATVSDWNRIGVFLPGASWM